MQPVAMVPILRATPLVWRAIACLGARMLALPLCCRNCRHTGEIIGSAIDLIPTSLVQVTLIGRLVRSGGENRVVSDVPSPLLDSTDRGRWRVAPLGLCRWWQDEFPAHNCPC